MNTNRLPIVHIPHPKSFYRRNPVGRTSHKTELHQLSTTPISISCMPRFPLDFNTILLTHCLCVYIHVRLYSSSFRSSLSICTWSRWWWRRWSCRFPKSLRRYGSCGSTQTLIMCHTVTTVAPLCHCQFQKYVFSTVFECVGACKIYINVCVCMGMEGREEAITILHYISR